MSRTLLRRANDEVTAADPQHPKVRCGWPVRRNDHRRSSQQQRTTFPTRSTNAGVRRPADIALVVLIKERVRAPVGWGLLRQPSLVRAPWCLGASIRVPLQQRVDDVLDLPAVGPRATEDEVAV